MVAAGWVGAKGVEMVAEGGLVAAVVAPEADLGEEAVVWELASAVAVVAEKVAAVGRRVAALVVVDWVSAVGMVAWTAVGLVVAKVAVAVAEEEMAAVVVEEVATSAGA